MSQRTSIEWTDATLNPWIGCAKVSPGCAHCYAENFNRRFHAGANWGKGAPRTPVALFRERAMALHRKSFARVEAGRAPLKVFPSMIDWLDEEVPVEMLADFLSVIHATPAIIWQLLTKRPENFHKRIFEALMHVENIKYGEPLDHHPGTDLGYWLNEWTRTDGEGIPQNIWVGVSVENQEYAEKRIPELLQIPAPVRFLSAEPLLGPLSLSRYLPDDDGYRAGGDTYVDWVIVGGESGLNARPCDVAWVRAIKGQCQAARVPVFVKQLGRHPFEIKEFAAEGRAQEYKEAMRLDDPKGGDLDEWPSDLRVREFPKAADFEQKAAKIAKVVRS